MLAENIRLSRYTLDLFRRLTETFGAEADISFHENGYLILASADGMPVLTANHRTQQAEGADIALEDADALGRRFSWLSTEGIAGGALGVSGEGWFDAHALLGLLRKALRTASVDMVTGEVVAIARQGDRVTGVTLADGIQLAAPAGLVDCTETLPEGAGPAAVVNDHT